MAWDRTWSCRNKGLTLQEFTKAAEAVVETYKGIQCRVGKESDD